MVIQHNLSALNAHRNIGMNNKKTAKNLEKLSSGFKVNRAADDAAGLAISEKMRGQLRGLSMGTQNVGHGIDLINVADGGMNEVHAILQRMRELSVQSANGTYHDAVDRENITKEMTNLTEEINRIADYTNYNGIYVLNSGKSPQKPSEERDRLELLSVALGDATDHTESFDLFGYQVDLDFSTDRTRVSVAAALDGGDIGANDELLDSPFGFNEVFGGSGADQFRNITRTSDGGFLVFTNSLSQDGDLDHYGNYETLNTGTLSYNKNNQPVAFDPADTNSGSMKTWVMKLTANGEREWSTVIGTPSNLHPVPGRLTPYSVAGGVELTNGNYAVVMMTGSNNGNVNQDAQIVILDQRGEFVAKTNYDPINNSDWGSPSGIIAGPNGTVVAFGYKKEVTNGQGTGYIRIVNSDGSLVRQQFSDGNSVSNYTRDDNYHDVARLTGGGYIAVGRTNNAARAGNGSTFSGGQDIMIQRLDDNLNILYSMTYGSNGTEDARAVVATPDGGYIMTGYVSGTTGSIVSTNGGSDMFAARFTADGALVWRETYGGSGNEIGYDIVDNGDGTLTIAGTTTSNRSGDVGASYGGQDGWFVKINGSDGSMISAANMGSAGDDSVTRIDGNGDGTYWFGGTVNSVGGIVGNDESVVKGSSDIWIAAFNGLTDKADKIVDVDIPDYALEADEKGNPSKYIKFDKVQGVFSSDGNTIKEMTFRARLMQVEPNEETGLVIHWGADTDQNLKIELPNMHTENIGIPKGWPDASTREKANDSIQYIDDAINFVSSERGRLGAFLNRLDHLSANNLTAKENLQNAESSIRDVDMAKEMMEFTKNNILVQASQSMLAQANQLPQGVLQLLR